MSESVDRKEIQGLVASGYNHLDCVRYWFLRVTNSLGARRWLASVVDKVTTAEHPGKKKSQNCLNIALTASGIAQLGVNLDSIKGFSHEFLGGMNRPEAALILGDHGDSDQKNWEFGGPNTEKTKPLHILVVTYGKDVAGLDAFATTCGLDRLPAGLQESCRQDSIRRHNDFTEPFGFRDGISQPKVIGLNRKAAPARDLIKPGEFVLGYEDEVGVRSRVPAIDNWQDPKGYLEEHPDYPAHCRGFGLNGTYLVFRKLRQEVRGFKDFVASASGNDPEQGELLAAQLMGRWRSGAPLVLAPKKPGSKPENDFLYTVVDPDGLRCPIGSHIRRANPRDALPVWPSRAVEISRRHRIIRRGRKYGVPAENSPGSDGPEYKDQGIYFIALNSSLLRQFEFIQHTWLNNSEFNSLDNDKDPIVGDNNGSGQFTIQAQPFNVHLKELPRFVTVKGGGYFFLPGIRTLRFLANYQPIATSVQVAQTSSGQGDDPSCSDE